MGDFQIKVQPKNYDVVIVGSGAGGGMAAYMLSKAGLSVALMEAGPMYDPRKKAWATDLQKNLQDWAAVLTVAMIIHLGKLSFMHFNDCS